MGWRQLSIRGCAMCDSVARELMALAVRRLRAARKSSRHNEDRALASIKEHSGDDHRSAVEVMSCMVLASARAEARNHYEVAKRIYRGAGCA